VLLLACGLATGAATLSTAVPARATSCAMPTPDNGDRYADVVFEATAVALVKPRERTRLAVSKVYKGSVPAQVEAQHGGMKGYGAFERGKRYLVYGVVRDGLFIHLCGATHELPASGMFADGPWKGWTVQSRYGAGHAPGGELRSGKAAKPAPTAPASADSSATPPPAVPSASASAPSAAAPAPAPFTPAKPVNPKPIPAQGSSSAGCGFGRGAVSGATAWPWLLALLFAVPRRRRSERPA
jgi:hypothetical protein